jgi:K+-transporting ATPase ATPase C chain
LDLPGIYLVGFPFYDWILQFMKQIRSALVIFIALTLLTGLLYPLTITFIAQMVFPFQANGSILENGGKRIGSWLIGQDFTDLRYFWGRPSAIAGLPYTPFDPQTLTGSSGSNWGPLSQSLVAAIQEHMDGLNAADPDNPLQIPVDLVTASASGLDPHISIAAAYYQIPRVARLRGINELVVVALVEQFTENQTLGFLGETRVNVLLLNLALDAIK